MGRHRLTPVPRVSRYHVPRRERLRSEARCIYAPFHSRSTSDTHVPSMAGDRAGGNEETYVTSLLPYLQQGWTVVNVEYRLAKISLAPAAVEDCLCALRWMYRNAKEYKIDTTKIVVTGHSAGGHLALATGMIPASAGLDRQCSGPENLKVAAIINWYGITDVVDLLDGPNMKSVRGQLDGQHGESGGNCQESFSTHVRPKGPSTNSDDPRRCRPNRSVCACSPFACGFDRGWRAQPVAHDSRWKSRRIRAGTTAESIFDDPGISEKERPSDQELSGQFLDGKRPSCS